MEVKRLAFDLFMKRMSFNHAVFLEPIKYFDKFVAGRFFLNFDITRVLLNIFNAINFVDTFEENNSGIRLFTLGSFLHSIDFAGEKAGKFVGVIATIEGNFFVSFF